MTNRTYTGGLLFLLAAGLVGCEGASPTSPTPPAHQALPPAASPAPGVNTLNGVTLFGVVFETTLTGPSPIADVLLYCDACGVEGHTWLETDANGYYSFSGDLDSGGGIWLSSGPTVLLVAKEGYHDPAGKPGTTGFDSVREVTINGDTRYDIQLVRR